MRKPWPAKRKRICLGCEKKIKGLKEEAKSVQKKKRGRPKKKK